MLFSCLEVMRIHIISEAKNGIEWKPKDYLLPVATLHYIPDVFIYFQLSLIYYCHYIIWPWRVEDCELECG